MRSVRRWSEMGLCLIVAIVAGCGGGGFGESVSVPQSERHRLAAGLGGEWSLRVPADRAFNVTDTQRESEGSARSVSTAESTGVAVCSVDASNGGSGVSQFQIGHVLSYDGSSPAEVMVTFEVAYDCVLERFAPRVGAKPLGLKAYILDSDRRALAKVMLVEGDPSRLPDRWSGAQSASFDVTFEPGLAYHLIVAGRVEVSGDDTPSPLASLSVRSVGIEVRSKSE